MNLENQCTTISYSFISHNRISFEISNNWGHRNKNGSWDGMFGMLHRREIDIGGTGSYMLVERIPVVEYIQLYTRTR